MTTANKPLSGATLAPILGVLTVGAIVLLYALWFLPGLRSTESLAEAGFVKWGLMWAALSIVVLSALVWNSAIAAATWKDAVREVQRQDIQGVLVLIAATFGIAFAASFFIDFGGAAGSTLTGTLNNPGKGFRVDEAARVNNLAAVVMIGLLTVACCVLSGASKVAGFEKLRQWQMRYQMLLWSSSAVLALGILQVYSLYQWGVETRVGGGIQQVAEGLTVGFGVLASAFACAIFIPVAVVQSARLNDLVAQARAQNPRLSRKDLLESHGFQDSSALEYVAKQVPLLAPLATSLVARAVG